MGYYRPVSERRVTIGDVASQAGVSVATVSKVINGRWGVAEQTEARVQAVIQQLGFQSSLVAQSLRSRRTNVIGVLVVDIEPFSAELLKGVARAIHGSGYELVVFSGCGRAADQVGWERRYLSRVSGTLCDGALLVTPSSIDVTFGAPVVAVDHNAGSSSLPSVDSDNFSGAVAATEHLLALGHRRIGFLAGRPDLESAHLRERGYRDALERAGLLCDPTLIRVGGYQPDSADDAARQLLELNEPPTAIFAANDVSALATISVARLLGLRVPDDLSVIGFDNVPESALSEPPLTTIEQPIQQMGFEAAKLLIQLIENKTVAATHTMLPTRLVVRGSCRALEEPA
jgi:LacI family transcriptional regulator